MTSRCRSPWRCRRRVCLQPLWPAWPAAPVGARRQREPVPSVCCSRPAAPRCCNTDFDITRIAVTNPAIADAVVVKPREVLVDGKGAGHRQPDRLGRRQRASTTTSSSTAGVSTLQQNLQQLFPGEDINVGVTDEAVILSGSVSSNDVMLRAAEVAKAALPKAAIVNMLQLPGGSPSKQVMLQVRFAEVNRNALLQAGLTLFTTRSGFHRRARTTQQFAGPGLRRASGNVGGLAFSDFLNLFFFNRERRHRRAC